MSNEMTKEEAIKHIKAMCQMLLGADNKPISDTYYALEMALEKLSAEPCEDAISRQASIDELKKYFSDDCMKDTECGAYWHHGHVIEVLQGMPSVIPQPKTGHCKDCKYFEYDSVAKVDGIPLIVAHEICSRWGNGCKTKEDGYCFMFEPQESEDKE